MTPPNVSCRFLAVLLTAQLALVAQATRPGPFFGTVVLLHDNRDGPIGEPGLHSFALLRGSQPQPFFGQGGMESDTLDRLFDGPSVFGPPLHSLFGPPPFVTELFGPPHTGRRHGCRKHQLPGQQDMMQHMAASRFGPHLLAALLEEAASEQQREQQQHQNTIDMLRVHADQLGMDLHQSVKRLGGEQQSAEVAAQKAGTLHMTVDDSVFEDSSASVASSWRVRDFVARDADSVDSSGEIFENWIHPSNHCLKLHRFPSLERMCRERLSGDMDLPAFGWLAKHHGTPTRSHKAAWLWDAFLDGQLTGSVLLFVLLCIACATVWVRLLLLWCAFRGNCAQCRGGPCGTVSHVCSKAADPIEDSLEAPLLNPLAHEAPIAGADEYKLQVAAAHAAPTVGYVTLQYVPLKGEA